MQDFILQNLLDIYFVDWTRLYFMVKTWNENERLHKEHKWSSFIFHPAFQKSTHTTCACSLLLGQSKSICSRKHDFRFRMELEDQNTLIKLNSNFFLYKKKSIKLSLSAICFCSRGLDYRDFILSGFPVFGFTVSGVWRLA